MWNSLKAKEEVGVMQHNKSGLRTLKPLRGFAARSLRRYVVTRYERNRSWVEI